MTTTTDGYTIGWPVAQRLQRWARRVGLAGKLAIALAVAVAVSGVATYAAWTGSSTDAQDLQLVLGLLVVDMILLLSLGALIARQLVRLYVERRSGSAGSRLHTRFVGLFSLVAVAPAIIVAVFSALFFHLVIQTWFSDRIRNAVEGSQAIAQAYVAEHRKAIRADILAMANDLNRVAPRLARNAGLFNQVLSTQAALRTLSEATVFDSSGRVLARTTLSLAAAFDAVPLEAVGRVNSGEVVVFASDTEDQVRALMRLEGFLDAYLYVGRFVEHQVVSYVQQTQEAVAQYEMLEGARSSVQLMSALIFIIVALMLLLVAVWLGLLFANRLVRPISALVLAAERVRQGDLLARVPEGDSDDEIGTLSRAFNRMTNQLEAQRNEVLEANRKLDRRRRFTETVLAGVSAGVVGLDRDGRINLPNQTAADLLGSDIDTLIGQRFENVVPELGLLLAEARSRPNRVVDGQVSLNRGDKRRTLRVRVTADRSREERQGFVITFDDITELLQAQRTAAWADVARRIAHEIKNPLTPIQLSAERLRRKYRDEITTDREVFERCTETIIRHVGDIGRMVDEFSAFARMPAPSLRQHNVTDIVRQSVFPQQVAHPDIEYVSNLPEAPIDLRCDSRQIGQVLTNVLKNAAEAIQGREPADDLPTGRIGVTLEDEGPQIMLTIRDNGRGLPPDQRERLTEPYVTTRTKGTGLGLAIVKKIVEDHGGQLALADAPGGGACVTVTFPIKPNAGSDDTADTPPPSGRREDKVASHGT